MSPIDHAFLAGIAIGGTVGLVAGALFVTIVNFFALRRAVKDWQ